MQTYSYTATWMEAAVRIASVLVTRSVWFELTPLPDDQFRFTVKVEEKDRLRDAAGTLAEF